MEFDIDYLHHVGHVVADMAEGLALYRRLGFVLPPPTYPMFSLREGAPPEPIGAANTHATFARNFVELATKPSGEIPPGAHRVPLQAPAEHLPQITDALGRVGAMFASWIARYEGLHILALHTPDANAVAARLGAAGIRHGGTHTVQRPVETADGLRATDIRFVEIGEPASAPLLPEGRVVVAETPSEASRNEHTFIAHHNGAIDLVESVLCVDEAELSNVERRYEQYLGRPARRAGNTRTFELAGARLILLTETELTKTLPGERAPELPAFVAYAVAVRDLGATRELLLANDFPLVTLASGDFFVPSAAALGTAIIFRQAH